LEKSICLYICFEVISWHVKGLINGFKRALDLDSVCANFQVIIIYEPTVGSLLSKGLQRLGGTVFAIVISLICSQIADNSGRGEVYLIPVFLYLGAHVLGFLRQVLFSSVPNHLDMLNVIRHSWYNFSSL